MHTAAVIVAAILAVPGLLLLVAGTSIYDAAIMVIGFVFGAGLTGTAVTGTGLTESTAGAAFVLVLLAGVVAAYLAIAFHNLFIIALGFVGGAVGAVFLLQGTGMPATPTGALTGAPTTPTDVAVIIALVLGGLLGAGLGWLLFRAAVILATAVIGAGLTTAGTTILFHDPGTTITVPDLDTLADLALQNELLFLALVFLGILIQGVQTRRTRRREGTEDD